MDTTVLFMIWVRGSLCKEWTIIYGLAIGTGLGGVVENQTESQNFNWNGNWGYIEVEVQGVQDLVL